MSVLAGLKKQRGVNKGKLTNLTKYAIEDHSETDLGELSTRLRRVEKLMEEFTDLELRIFQQDPEEQSDLTYEENYYTAVSALNKWIRSKSLDQGVISLETSNNATQNYEQTQIKLPKINIPTFYGEYAEWQSFYDLYTSTIHESPILNSVQKFQYLKGLLRGEAAVLLRHITVTEGNYIGALNKLKERYDRKKIIINLFIRTFMEQPVIHTSTAANLKRLMDTSDEVIRGLQALGEVATGRDPWLTYILMHKLDEKTKSLWAEHAADTTSPDFSEFLKFLARRIDTLESVTSSGKRMNPKGEVKSHVASSSSDHKAENHSDTESGLIFQCARCDDINNEVKSHVASSASNHKAENRSNTKSGFTFQCAMCDDINHSIYYCNQFHALSAEERQAWVKKTNRCFNCLGTNHPIFRCPSRRRCQKCNKKHNTLIHQDETSTDTIEQPQPSSSAPGVKVTLLAKCNVSAILPTAIIHVVDTSGMTIPCRALLDSGSQSSFITESCAQRLQLKKRNARISIRGMGQIGAGTSKGLVTIIIKPEGFPQLSIEALVMSKITSQIPSQDLSANFKAWSGIRLADPQFNTKGNIDILIGADYFFSILLDGQIKTTPDEPILQNTLFGWVVSGQTSQSRNNELVSMLTIQEDIVDIDRSLRKFWELESISEENIKLSPEEEFCERHFAQNLTRDHENRFVVKLPFKKSPALLGESLACAIQRLRGMERRFVRDHNFAQLYHQFMREYEVLNHMEELPPKVAGNQFYLPHHGVLKRSSSTTKLRVVFDGSAKSSSGISLNECLAVGPNVQSSLFAIILRFREHKVVFSADVEKMYRQINVSSDDTKYQKIVWRSNPSEPIRYFRLTTVTYGLASASYLATRTIKQISEEHRQSSPHAAHVISRDIYVDDLMTGADDEVKASQLKEKISEILASHGFNLRKWKSNNPNVLHSIPRIHQEADNKPMQDQANDSMDSVKVLGIEWNPKSDNFTFTSNIQDKSNFTKRIILSEASRLFDPLGWLAPVVITFKIFLQSLWGANLDWDEPLPSDKYLVWERLRDNLKSISAFSIPRSLETTSSSAIEMHGFCDASQLAYATVVFFKIVNEGGVTVRLITAKTRVAPVKQQSLPRLELCAAVLLADLTKIIKRESNLSINEVYTWTDSQIVLDWLASHPRRWKTFIGNRTSEILSTLPRKNWRHVSSAENPADCASRGLSPNELKSHKLWWNGPTWLQQTSEFWPPQNQNYGSVEEEAPNKQFTFSLATTTAIDWYDEIISKYSSFGRLLRVISYVIKFARSIAKPKQSRPNSISLQREELLQTTRILCQHEQRKYYENDIKDLQAKGQVRKGSSLQSLNPFLDEFGLLRVGGRLQNSLTPYSTRHPLIIHGKSKIAELILRDNHIKNKHAGPTLLLGITRQEYWIPNGKIKAKEVIRRCVICTKFKWQCEQQLMGSLPASRVELIRPFFKAGVDYAGPISIHLAKGRGQKTYKAYICLFVCLSTKAVHLELVGDLSSDAFLGALKRFTARRGVCSELHSDNGTNFTGADTKLQNEFNKLIKNSSHIANYFANNRIDWHFIPPNAPHFGGLWEAAIKSTKFHIKRVIGKNILTIEEMNTLLAEVEGILNSRPMCAINDTEVDPITPAHFLIGHPLTKIPESDITHLKISHLTRWQLVQQISQHFWKKWYIEYLTSLQQRSKWRTRTPSLQIDDVVLIKDNNLPVNHWLLGKVTELHPGSDGQVRVVTVKTQHNQIKRPIQKLCLLPISRAEPDEVHD